MLWEGLNCGGRADMEITGELENSCYLVDPVYREWVRRQSWRRMTSGAWAFWWVVVLFGV